MGQSCPIRPRAFLLSPTCQRQLIGAWEMEDPPSWSTSSSGPDDRVDGLAAYLSKLGVPCVDLDIVNYRQGEVKSSHDLSSDSLWETLRSELEGGRILALWFGIPCFTFSKQGVMAPVLDHCVPSTIYMDSRSPSSETLNTSKCVKGHTSPSKPVN